MNRTLVWISVTLRVAIPLCLLLLPADFFDKGQTLCVSKLLTSTDCPACGLTRACMHLIHFQFEEAYAFNMFSFIAFPVLSVVWAMLFVKDLKRLIRLNRSISVAK